MEVAEGAPVEALDPAGRLRLTALFKIFLESKIQVTLSVRLFYQRTRARGRHRPDCPCCIVFHRYVQHSIAPNDLDGSCFNHLQDGVGMLGIRCA